MARVLIIEDETVLRTSMVRGLSKMPGLEVVGAGSLGEALARIDEQPPQLVFSDLDLPDRSGIELLGELGQRGLRVPVVFVTAYLKAYGSQIPPHADVRILEKPVELDELRRIVSEVLDGPERTAAAPFGLVDYLQLACMGHHTVVIRVRDGGLDVGRIIVASGQLWSAQDGAGKGEEAFFRLANAAGSASCARLDADPGSRDIEGSWGELVLEAARRADEAQLGSGDAAAEEAPAPIVAEEDEPEPEGTDDEAFRAAMERGLEALLERNYGEARRAFLAAQAIRPEDRNVRANLARLDQMGVGGSSD